jgi:hypothetical protein
MTDHATSPASFDPEDWHTWPFPDHAVSTRWPDGRPRRLTDYGDGWFSGFDQALTVIEAAIHMRSDCERNAKTSPDPLHLGMVKFDIAMRNLTMPENPPSPT